MFTKGRYFRKSFEPKGLSIAPKTLANFLKRKTQLYEQGATVRRIGLYVRNWWRWVRAGVEIRDVSIDCLRHQPECDSRLGDLGS